MWFCRKKGQFEFRSFGGSPYVILPSSHNCWVAEGGVDVAYFENMWITPAKLLHVEHFAVDGLQKGRRKAEPVLRSFASLVAKQAPEIYGIEFHLGRAAEGSNIKKLAAARVGLFKRIGASSIQQQRLNSNSLVVSAVWGKAQW